MYVCYYSTWGIYFPPLNVPFINWAGGMNAWHQCHLGNAGSLTSIKERLSAQANHQMKLKAIADTVILCWQEHSIIANTQQVKNQLSSCRWVCHLRWSREFTILHVVYKCKVDHSLKSMAQNNVWSEAQPINYHQNHRRTEVVCVPSTSWIV